METQGHYASEQVVFDAPGPANAITVVDVVLPYRLALLSASLDAKGVNDGDLVGLDIAPETTVGVLDVAVAIGATVITMPAGVMALFTSGDLFIGMRMHLDDTVNKDPLGLVIAYDVTAKTVTVKTATANAFAITTTQIKFTGSLIPGALGEEDDLGWFEVSQGDSKVFVHGESKIGATTIDGGKKIRFRYKNKAGVLARVRIKIEGLY